MTNYFFYLTSKFEVYATVVFDETMGELICEMEMETQDMCDAINIMNRSVNACLQMLDTKRLEIGATKTKRNESN
jgi:hypothetical protein